MIVYQIDAGGYLVGPVKADANPVRPGAFIIPGGCVTAIPPLAPAGKRARFVAGAWTLVNAVPTAPAPPPLTPAEILEREREGMKPYARAFFAALKFFPSPGFLHMLDRYSQAVAASRVADPYNDLVVWNDRVTIVIRAHDDMEAFRIAFSLPETLLDQIFRVAIAIENGATQAEIMDMLS